MHQQKVFTPSDNMKHVKSSNKVFAITTEKRLENIENNIANVNNANRH
jgi:hypothetical protein